MPMPLLKNIHIKLLTLFMHGLGWGSFILFPLLLSPLPHPVHESFDRDSFLNPVLFGVFLMMLFYFNAYFLIAKYFNKKTLVIYVTTLILLVPFMIMSPVLVRQFVSHREIGIPHPFPFEKKQDEGFSSERREYFQPIREKVGTRFLVSPVYRLIVPGVVGVMIISTAFGLMVKYDKQNKERETETLKSEIVFLRSRFNSHFMLNTLNNLISLARKKSDLLEPSLLRLAGLMQYMLNDSGNEKVNLSQEVEYLKNYIELQKLRFGQNVLIDAQLDDLKNDPEIAPLILITFVENAFKHGILLTSASEINIRLDVTGQMLSFIVRNKFNPEKKDEGLGQSTDEAKNSGIGLTNVKRRLNLLYPDKHELKIVQDNNWYTVNLSMMLL
jgi:hypothetical protein